MQRTITITIPDPLVKHVRGIRNLDEFVSGLTIKALQDQGCQPQEQELAEAAKLMLHEYSTDPELTSFSALDGEPVYE